MNPDEKTDDFSNSLITAFLVKSFSDYQKFIEFAVEKLSKENALRFCLWILSRFREDFATEILFDGFTPGEKIEIEEIISRLKSLAESESGLLADFARESKVKIEGFESADENYAYDNPNGIGMESLEFSDALSCTLSFCHDPNPDYVCGVSEAMINCLDHHTAATGYNLENMFTFPDMEKEINLQKLFINQLLSVQNNQLWKN